MKRRGSYPVLMRYGVCLLGIAFMAFGIALTVKTNLGTSPLSILPYVASMKWRPSFGEFSGLYNICLLILQIALLRKNFPKLQYLQLPMAFLFSVFIDVWMLLLPEFATQPTGVRAAALCLGTMASGFGIFLEVKSNVVMLPGEGMVKALTAVTQKDFGILKICFDLANVALGLLLSFLLFHEFKGFGVGTIVSGIFVGACVKLFQSLHHRLLTAGSA